MKDEELVESMVKFMKQSNEMFTSFAIEINNIKVDIAKLKKHQAPRIIVPSKTGNSYLSGAIVNAVGKEYKLDNGGNGEYKGS